MENEVVDTTSTDAPDTSTEIQGLPNDTIQSAEPEFKPFANGKEKFKVNGAEEEWDWDTTKRYAQIGKSGYSALEKAAATEKKAQETLRKLQDAASKDPEGLIQILTGNANWRAQMQQAAKSEQANNPGASTADLENRIRQQMQAEYGPLKDKLEAMEVEKERQLVNQELDTAVKKFPELDTPIHRDLVKQYYARALKNGLTDIDLEDVAFHVSQELKQYSQAQQKKVVEKLEDNKRRAPVVTRSGGKDADAAMTIDDVKRLAGRM